MQGQRASNCTKWSFNNLWYCPENTHLLRIGVPKYLFYWLLFNPISESVDNFNLTKLLNANQPNEVSHYYQLWQFVL